MPLCRLVDAGKRHGAVEPWAEIAVVADKNQSGVGVVYFAKQQIEEGAPRVRVEGRGWFVRDDERWRANERAGNSDPLLLSGTEFCYRPPG